MLVEDMLGKAVVTSLLVFATTRVIVVRISEITINKRISFLVFGFTKSASLLIKIFLLASVKNAFVTILFFYSSTLFVKELSKRPMPFAV